MNQLFKYLKEAGIKFFCLQSRALLGHNASSHSIGIAYMPPSFARNLNVYADKGEVYFNMEFVEFYFGNLTAEELTPKDIERIRGEIMTLGMGKSHDFPSVCAFLSRDAITKLLGLIEYQSKFYWPLSVEADNNKLYEIYFDKNGMVRARFPDQKGLFFLN